MPLDVVVDAVVKAIHLALDPVQHSHVAFMLLRVATVKPMQEKHHRTAYQRHGDWDHDSDHVHVSDVT
jgi:hypothetical protein